MFLCVSPNPAIDKRLTLRALTPGKVLRAGSMQANPGGKAAHVAMVLRTLQADPLWLGFTGGDSGRRLIAGLHDFGIRTEPVSISKETRMNLEIHEQNGRITEILEPGPVLDALEISAFENACKRIFAQGRKDLTVIFSGSLPSSAPSDFYATLIAHAHESGCRIFLDTSGKSLHLGLAARPHFIKPNREEAEQLLGSRIDSLSAAARAIGQLHSFGAENVALSLGSDGLLFSPGKEAQLYFASIVVPQPKSTVGCGDAVVAGFAYAAATSLSPEGSLRVAVACAAANCLASSAGMLGPEDIQHFQERVQVRFMDRL